ncbi:MAG: hypothetical protein WCG98_01110 [bacterium]
MANYGAFLISDFLVFFVIVLLVIANKFIRKRIWKIINNIVLLCIFLLFVIDIVAFLIFQSRISVFDFSEILNPSVVNLSWSIM